jgi:hypothetical protein
MSENRETANADMDQVIPRSAVDIASSRAEETMYHAAAGASGFHLGKCPVCVPTA